MQIIFRADASLEIGSGHIMRCLTLANSLSAKGAEVTFLIRNQPGNFKDLIVAHGHQVCELPAIKNKLNEREDFRPPYGQWFGVFQEEDAQDTIKKLNNIQPDWLIVDHYAIDSAWHKALRPYVKKIMVIDDLADRNYDCDLLLDQNYFHNLESRYLGKVLPSTQTLLGPYYALLRPEFHEIRKQQKLIDKSEKRIFVFFGGSDQHNLTSKTLEALDNPQFSDLQIDVVIGAQNLYKKSIKKQVQARAGTNLYVQVSNIADIMARADFSIGAGGSTTWERLCLGIPTIVVTFAENQVKASQDLNELGLIHYVGDAKQIISSDIKNSILKMINNPNYSIRKEILGKDIVDGCGVNRVVKFIMKSTKR